MTSTKAKRREEYLQNRDDDLEFSCVRIRYSADPEQKGASVMTVIEVGRVHLPVFALIVENKNRENK